MMQKHLFNAVRYFGLVCGMTALAGCGWTSESNVRSGAENATMLSGLSLKNIFGLNEKPKGPITVYDAIALGLHHNLESRAAFAAPSTDIIPASFTTLEAGIDYVGSTHPAAAALRKHKAAQNIIRDVRTAYFQVTSAERLEANFTHTLTETGPKNPDVALQDLEKIREQATEARAELADLLNVSDPESLQLAYSDDQIKSLEPVSTPLADLELLALTNRLETGSVNPDAKLLRDSALNTFPGIKDMLTRSRNGDGALSEEEWDRFSETFTPGLVRIHALNLELQQPENKARLAALRQQALSAAIMAQMHIAYAHYRDAYREMETAKNEFSGNAMQSYRAEAELQIAYSDFLNALGVEILPENAERMSIARLSDALQERVEKAGIARPVKQPGETDSLLQKASFSLPYTRIRIPPAQKISFKKPVKQLPYAQLGLLNISDRQIQTLLKAPISEP